MSAPVLELLPAVDISEGYAVRPVGGTLSGGEQQGMRAWTSLVHADKISCPCDRPVFPPTRLTLCHTRVLRSTRVRRTGLEPPRRLHREARYDLAVCR